MPDAAGRPRRIYVSSPFGSPDPWIVWLNVQVARDVCRAILERGDAPYASHLIYPEVLGEDSGAARETGLQAALAFVEACDEVAWALPPWVDGPTPGMRGELRRALELGKPVWRATIPEDAIASGLQILGRGVE